MSVSISSFSGKPERQTTVSFCVMEPSLKAITHTHLDDVDTVQGQGGQLHDLANPVFPVLRRGRGNRWW